MADNTIYPENELAQIDKAIIKYQVMLKSINDPLQRKIYETRIQELKASRGQIDNSGVLKKREGFPKQEIRKSILAEIMATVNKKDYSTDEEINALCIYLHFFYNEFLSIFSERKMKLDFKFSLVRDNFHYLYQELARDRDDYLEDVNRSKQGKLQKDMQLEFKRRTMQRKRNFLIEAYKFFKELEKFTYVILNDLKGSELICLNGDNIINFDLVEEKRYLEGYTIRDGMQKLYHFITELIDFLNIPDNE